MRKVKAGANSAITQYFYNADAYFHFVDEARAAGVDVPIVPGIMPIAGFTKLARFSDACGADIPRWMRKKFEGFGDDTDSIRAFGLDVDVMLAEGDARKMILKAAEHKKPDLLVIARHSNEPDGGFISRSLNLLVDELDYMTFGSVSAFLARRAPCPVLIQACP